MPKSEESQALHNKILALFIIHRLQPKHNSVFWADSNIYANYRAKGHDIFFSILLYVVTTSASFWRCILFGSKKLIHGKAIYSWQKNWMFSEWFQCERKVKMSLYLQDKKGVACDLDIVQKCCINCKLLAWKHCTFHIWLSLSFQTHQVAWERTTALLNHTFQQYIHSHILDVILQNTRVVCTTQLLPGSGSNCFQSTV